MPHHAAPAKDETPGKKPIKGPERRKDTAGKKGEEADMQEWRELGEFQFLDG